MEIRSDREAVRTERGVLVYLAKEIAQLYNCSTTLPVCLVSKNWKQPCIDLPGSAANNASATHYFDYNFRMQTHRINLSEQLVFTH